MPHNEKRKISTTGNARMAGMALLGAVAYPGLSGAFDIQFDYTFDGNGFFADTARQDVLNAAAGFFESYITDDLLAITSGGGNSFNPTFFNPATGASETINGFSVAADTLVIYVGGRDLGFGTLGLGGPGGYSAGGSSAFINDAISRGEGDGTADAVRNPSSTELTATEFATWGGSISFNSSATWYFDSDTTTDEVFSGNDFYSVALHELGHVLGFGIADSWDNLINTSTGEFTGANSVAAYGGNVPLTSTGSHWAESTDPSPIYGTSTDREAAMDPTIVTGTRKHFTELDMAGLEDIGWTITPASAQ